MESAIKAAGFLTARQAAETPGWEHGSLNKSGHRQLGICKPAITELAGCRTARPCHSLLILLPQQKRSLCSLWIPACLCPKHCDPVGMSYFCSCISTLHITTSHTCLFTFIIHIIINKSKKKNLFSKVGTWAFWKIMGT